VSVALAATADGVAPAVEMATEVSAAMPHTSYVDGMGLAGLGQPVE
jgi:hypothetical protein